MTEQFNSGELRTIFRINFQKSLIGLMVVGKYACQQEEEQKRRYQYCTDDSGQLFFSELFKHIQDAILIDLSLQDNVVIQGGFVNIFTTLDVLLIFHSIINSGLIPGGQNSSKRQTVFFLLIDPRDKSHKDPENIDLRVPRRAQYFAQRIEETSRTRYIGSTSILRFGKD